MLCVRVAHAGDELLQEPRHVVEAVIGPHEVLVGEGVGEGVGRYPDAIEVMEVEGLGEDLPRAQAIGDRVHEVELPIGTPR